MAPPRRGPYRRPESPRAVPALASLRAPIVGGRRGFCYSAPDDLTPRPPSLRGKGVPSSNTFLARKAREPWTEETSMPKAPPSLGGKGAGGLGRRAPIAL